MAFNLLTDRFHRGMRPQETIGQCLVFAQQAQQQVFGLYIRRAKLAGLIARKEYDAPGFLCIPLEHISLTQMLPSHLSRKAPSLLLVRSPGPARKKLKSLVASAT